VEDIWGPSDVYGLNNLTGDSRPVIMGQVLKGMKPKDEPNPKKALMPIAWIKSWTGPSGKKARVFTTTMGHGGDFKSEESAASSSMPPTGASTWKTTFPSAATSRSWALTIRRRSAWAVTARASSRRS